MTVLFVFKLFVFTLSTAFLVFPCYYVLILPERKYKEIMYIIIGQYGTIEIINSKKKLITGKVP